MPQKSVACVIVEVMTGCRLIVMTGAAHQTLIISSNTVHRRGTLYLAHHAQARLGAVLRVGGDPVLDTGVTAPTCSHTAAGDSAGQPPPVRKWLIT